MLEPEVATDVPEEVNDMNEEVTSMSLEDKKELLIRALKKTYKRLYQAVCPIPYMQEKTFSVHQVFIDSGVEKNESSTSEDLEDLNSASWQPLESYNAIFSCRGSTSSRIFVLGAPGYGKSTLTLQLAYDWCNDVDSSFTRDIDILILLRLRQFSGRTSISKAIKIFLLKGEKITVQDIDSIFQEYSSSIKIIFDGYDEYLEQDDVGFRPIDKVIMREELPNIDVAITTRYLPKTLPTESQIMRLQGFDTDAREEYIGKAIVDDARDDLQLFIKEKLEDNSVLGDLCKIPLLFVMFVHVALEKDIDLGDFSSMTDTFRFLISCFHDHFRNKLRDANVNNVYRYEHDHSALDKLSFEALSKHRGSTIWSKESVIKQLSKDFYDRYKTLGILVEEETVCDDFMRTIKVRFYHGIMCEWYAAHYLSFLASKENTVFKENVEEENSFLADCEVISLGKLDPSNFEYVFRFACGLRLEAVKKITDYLFKIKGGDMFGMLCHMEQVNMAKKTIDGIKNLCEETISFETFDTKLSQRSLVLMLKIASTHKFPVHCLFIDATLVKVVNGKVFIGDEFHLPPVEVKTIVIDVIASKMTAKDILAVSSYARNSQTLESIVVIIPTEPSSFPENHILLNESFVQLTYKNRRYRPNADGKLWEKEEGFRKRKALYTEHQMLRKQRKKKSTDSVSSIQLSRIRDDEKALERQKTGDSSGPTDIHQKRAFCNFL